MNHTSRRERIEAMLAAEPGDRFLRYSLAMEWEKEAEHDKSLELLNELMHDQPPLVAAFFRAAQQLATLDRIDQARFILREGIEEARRQGDTHAASEMAEFLSSLGTWGE